ncbi:MAG: cbb3-type cytochrome c oxidase subunit I [Hyphomicrobiales bacterium]|nr:cbb3-type cytochrome c oxidase subunit I [Hyphomicrobiales bacterium]
MSHAVRTSHAVGRAQAASAAGALRRELGAWAWLAVAALAVAGVFALLLALSRIPGMEEAPFWPLGFFYKGLVIHVVFSLVIWLLGVFAFLVTVATLDVVGEGPGTDGLRGAPLGRIGQGIVLVSFPCLFAPAFLNATQPELANYIPLIRHPAYDLGLVLLAIGILAPVARLLINLPGRAMNWPPLTFAMAIGGFVYLLALLAFAIAAILLAREGIFMASHELLFWGGGHLLSFVYALVLLTNWMILARRVFAEDAIAGGRFRIAAALAGALALPAPFFYLAFAPFSEGQHEAFRLLQFGLAAPTLMFAVALIARARSLVGAVADRATAHEQSAAADTPRSPSTAADTPRSGAPRSTSAATGARWPRRDPAFFALAASLALFALGGVLGFLVGGYDTRIPAHYHAVVTAVSVSSAGMLLTFGLERLGRAPAPARAVRALIALYAGGQLVASIAMFVAGGYGAARKTPTGAGSLDPIAAAGMAMHGIASIFTVLGGAAFVVVAIRALSRPPAARPGVP